MTGVRSLRGERCGPGTHTREVVTYALRATFQRTRRNAEALDSRQRAGVRTCACALQHAQLVSGVQLRDSFRNASLVRWPRSIGILRVRCLEHCGVVVQKQQDAVAHTIRDASVATCYSKALGIRKLEILAERQVFEQLLFP